LAAALFKEQEEREEENNAGEIFASSHTSNLSQEFK
jgi:hypothetical protein